jgi:orotidine-5'-phosphate decarboxylase
LTADPRLIVALDLPSIEAARAMVDHLGDHVSFYKLGLWLAYAQGAERLITDLQSAGKRIFLDAKMYDIGLTVEEGIKRVADRGIDFVTIHGEPQIIESAVKGKRGSNLQVLAVTVLTSLNDAALRRIGYQRTAQQLVHMRVKQAAQGGCDGVIASAADNPRELRKIARKPQFKIVTPGIRESNDETDDHERKMGAKAAIAAGADYLVIGRPIIRATDPLTRVQQIIASMG